MAFTLAYSSMGGENDCPVVFPMVGYLQFAYGLINSCDICIIPHMEKSFYCHFYYFFKINLNQTGLH